MLSCQINVLHCLSFIISDMSTENIDSMTPYISDSEKDSECENDHDDEISKIFPLLNQEQKKITVLEARKTSAGNYDNKKHACLYCEKILANMSRHLTLVHVGSSKNFNTSKKIQTTTTTLGGTCEQRRLSA